LLQREGDLSEPTISAIIPVHNGGRYLEEAIGSVVAQDPGVLEIIVVDDGSTDESGAIARSHAPQVHYCWQAASGAGAARNRGVELAAGDFLAFLDADDRWVEGKLRRQIAAFGEDPTIDMVFGQVRQLREGEQWENGIAEATCDPSQLMPGIVPGTLLVRKETFLRVGYLRTDCRVGEFVDWYMRAMELRCRAKMLTDLLLWRRIHDSNLGIRERKRISDYARILKAGLDRRRAGGQENS
jgi:glycosyltransferase involved in cell wall biosynthesis